MCGRFGHLLHLSSVLLSSPLLPYHSSPFLRLLCACFPSSTMLQTEIEVNAPPSKVREVVCLLCSPRQSPTDLDSFYSPQLLDNSRYEEWVTTLVRKLSPDNPSQALESLQAGDKVQCDMDGMQFIAVIKVCFHSQTRKRHLLTMRRGRKIPIRYSSGRVHPCTDSSRASMAFTWSPPTAVRRPSSSRLRHTPASYPLLCLLHCWERNCSAHFASSTKT